MRDELQAARVRLQEVVGAKPFDAAIILGSGLGSAFVAETQTSVPYAEIPGLHAAPGVPGHAGTLAVVELEGWRLLVFRGRLHLYQGFTARQAAFPIRLAHALGSARVLLCNAAGGVSADYRPGDFVYLADHINLQGDNPLRGERDRPFIDLSRLYRADLYPILRQRVTEAGIVLHRGVYAAVTGPSYETPAEVRALRVLGADLVGMSTVPEAIMAQYLGMEVVALSLVSNAAAGLTTAELTHDEVLAAGHLAAARFDVLCRLLLRVWMADAAK